MEIMRKLVNQLAYTPHQNLSNLTPLQRSLIPLLSFSSSLYKLSISLRQHLYHYGFLHKHRLPVAVISVGNLTWGGNGKTPMVEYLATLFINEGIVPLILTKVACTSAWRWQFDLERKWKRPMVDYLATRFVKEGICPLILARGYAGGDEAKMLQRHFLGTPSKVGIGANRYATATRFLERYGYVDFRVGACFEGLFLRHEVEIACNADNIGVVILDDGMQHLSLSRDLEIVMVNAIMLWGNSQLLPLGPLREPLAALERADVVVIHHADLVPNGELKLIELKIQQLKETLPIIFHSRLVPSYFFEAKNKCSKLPLSVMHNMAVLCVSAIGSANAFMQVIQKMGQLYTDRMDFSDHHSFQAKDIEMIRGKLRELQSNFDAKPIVVVTEKDYDRNPIILKELDPFEVLVLCSHLQIIPSIGRTEDSFMRVLKHFLELKFS